MPTVRNVRDYLRYLRNQNEKQYFDAELLDHDAFQDPTVLISPEGCIGIYITQLGFWETESCETDDWETERLLNSEIGSFPCVQALFHISNNYLEFKNFLLDFNELIEYEYSLKIDLLINVTKLISEISGVRKYAEIDRLGKSEILEYTGKKGQTLWEPKLVAYTLIPTNQKQEKVFLPYVYTSLDFNCEYYFFGSADNY